MQLELTSRDGSVLYRGASLSPHTLPALSHKSSFIQGTMVCPTSLFHLYFCNFFRWNLMLTSLILTSSLFDITLSSFLGEGGLAIDLRRFPNIITYQKIYMPLLSGVISYVSIFELDKHLLDRLFNSVCYKDSLGISII